jgi:hypothetical protein
MPPMSLLAQQREPVRPQWPHRGQAWTVRVFAKMPKDEPVNFLIEVRGKIDHLSSMKLYLQVASYNHLTCPVIGRVANLL